MAWFWPRVDDPKAAKRVASAAVDVTFLYTLIGALGCFAGVISGQFNWKLGVAVLLTVVSGFALWGIYKKMSRAWAIVAFLYLMTFIVLQYSRGSYKFSWWDPAIDLLLFFVFLRAVKGTFAFHRFAHSQNLES